MGPSRSASPSASRPNSARLGRLLLSIRCATVAGPLRARSYAPPRGTQRLPNGSERPRAACWYQSPSYLAAAKPRAAAVLPNQPATDGELLHASSPVPPRRTE
ncbi:hypothetical protein BU16DRAFT_526787 [Lophium mytilinum]|uniref:Uncharacterized protein n=1 Tax=Lophium mytilinum TaxID=390894 RepID=A0A6A6QV71_9PEZI|nr:hypothetical protein BU16DRAFT_526787 [Lophium mytilinum]